MPKTVILNCKLHWCLVWCMVLDIKISFLFQWLVLRPIFREKECAGGRVFTDEQSWPWFRV